MTKKMQTMDLQGKAYAGVPVRVKEFREDCPTGDIQTTPTLLPDNTIMFKAYILKDKSNEHSASATGHAIGKNTGAKAFEKLETIAVGRALALLGYMASGDIASGEEMEEFIEYQNEKKSEAIEQAIFVLQSCTTLKELQETWKSLGTLIKEKEVIAVKDALKTILK